MNGDDPLLGIGVFARRSRLSLKALRLYDRHGLLRPARVDPGTGYRQYRESQLETARLVVMLRRLDMPLARVAEVISVSPARGAELLTGHWAEVERRVAGQRELLTHLKIKLTDGDGRFADFDVQRRDVPEQLVLTEQRHVQVEDLSCWIGTAIARLMRSAGEHGGTAGNWFVVYYGDVSEDSDGPAEICVPIGAPREGTDAALRREPAHHEVYVTLRKAQVGFPQIFSAYDAVAHWAAAHGLTVAGSPREVYFTDFHAAAPADDVCDVALPVR